ncbi:MAG: putative peptidase [Candidatus Saccharibacteria bacterium]|nr:putative peptidase [Candidatus Saccharibacteria bacterium]
MLQHKMVYTIEQHKVEAILIFYMAVIAVMLPVSIFVHHISTSSTVSAAASPPGVVLSHTVVNLDPAKLAAAAATGQSIWPLHGKVTTEFGTPHRPWQPTHTGIDISSAQRSGSAAIVAFRDGTVAQVVRSSSGLGNHVVVDHGNGITSVYGHLYSSNVVEGQRVRAGDSIGREGSTGASTGTHLHFEIWENNIPKSPRRYIEGTP